MNLGLNGVMDAMGGAIQKIWHHEAQAGGGARRSRATPPTRRSPTRRSSPGPRAPRAGPPGPRARARPRDGGPPGRAWSLRHPSSDPPAPCPARLARLPLRRADRHCSSASSGWCLRSRRSSTASIAWSSCAGASPSSGSRTSRSSSSIPRSIGRPQHPRSTSSSSCPSPPRSASSSPCSSTPGSRSASSSRPSTSPRWSPARWPPRSCGGGCTTRSSASSTCCCGWSACPTQPWLMSSRTALVVHHPVQRVEGRRLQHGRLPGRAPGDPGELRRGRPHRRSRGHSSGSAASPCPCSRRRPPSS